MNLDVVRRVAAAAAEADGAPPLDEGTWLALRHHPERFVALVQEDGYALLRGEHLDLAVAPEQRGQGRGRALATQILDGVDGVVHAWSHVDHPGARRLAEQLDFERTRRLWVMRLPHDVPVAATDLVVRPFRPGDEDELLRVNAAAFAQHPEQGALDHDGLAERMAEAWWDPADLLVAEEDGRMLGFHWTKIHPAAAGELPHGEVYVLGVDPTAQGRGLGKALTLAGLAHLRNRGVDHILLYVEADNDPAVSLYRRVGFTHDPRDTPVQYTRPRRPAER
jgi:mycothiol synthase